MWFIIHVLYHVAGTKNDDIMVRFPVAHLRKNLGAKEKQMQRFDFLRNFVSRGFAEAP